MKLIMSIKFKWLFLNGYFKNPKQITSFQIKVIDGVITLEKENHGCVP